MARIGSMSCPVPGCGNPDATASETNTGKLAWSCHRCEINGYANKGTKGHKLLSGLITLDDADPAPAPGAPAPPAPPAARKSVLLS